MGKKLYYIENCGCDDFTRGLVRLSDEEFIKFKEIVENLNKNSHYGCMPVIEVYELYDTNVKEVEYDPTLSWGDEGYIDKDDLLYMDEKTYVLTIERWDIYDKFKERKVI